MCGYRFYPFLSYRVGQRAIAAFGNEEQKKKYLTPLCKGEHIGAFALTEARRRVGRGSGKHHRRPDGDYYVLNGTKTFISNGPVANTFIVLHPPTDQGHKRA